MQIQKWLVLLKNLANYQVYFKDANLINTEITRFMKVTREDLQKAAQKISYKRKQSGIVLLAKNNKYIIRKIINLFKRNSRNEKK
jgi:predicted Zn-dependent peptidase